MNTVLSFKPRERKPRICLVLGAIIKSRLVTDMLIHVLGFCCCNWISLKADKDDFISSSQTKTIYLKRTKANEVCDNCSCSLFVECKWNQLSWSWIILNGCDKMCDLEISQKNRFCSLSIWSGFIAHKIKNYSSQNWIPSWFNFVFYLEYLDHLWIERKIFLKKIDRSNNAYAVPFIQATIVAKFHTRI